MCVGRCSVYKGVAGVGWWYKIRCQLLSQPEMMFMTEMQNKNERNQTPGKNIIKFLSQIFIIASENKNQSCLFSSSPT